jgi:hypothetical protein
MAAAVGCTASLAFAAPLHAQSAGSAAASEAYSLGASFTSLGMATSLGPVLDVAGSAPPAYTRTRTLANFTGSVAIPPLVPSGSVAPVVAKFSASARGLKSHVASGGIQIDFVSAVGTAKIDSANLSITQSGPPGSTIPVLLYLGVTASGVAASATYSHIFPLAPTVTGSASFAALSVSGSLLDGKTVTYTGSAPANTVLFQSPTVTVTAHQQLIAGVISCGPGCTFTPSTISVRALDINLNNAMIDGHAVTGDIVLGDASAR